MAYLALGALIVLLLLLIIRWVSRADPRQLLKTCLIVGLVIGGIVLAVLAFSGRMAAAGAIGFILLFAIRILRELRTPPHRASTQQGMTRQEAFDLLGLKQGASDAEIEAAYKKLIKKNHPDTGGTDGLTRKLNEARRILHGD